MIGGEPSGISGSGAMCCAGGCCGGSTSRYHGVSELSDSLVGSGCSSRVVSFTEVLADSTSSCEEGSFEVVVAKDRNGRLSGLVGLATWDALRAGSEVELMALKKALRHWKQPSAATAGREAMSCWLKNQFLLQPTPGATAWARGRVSEGRLLLGASGWHSENSL